MNKRNNNKRVIIIGLDGVPYHLIENLSNSGIMPETRKLVENGILSQMESSIPEVSSVAWSSMITGKNPGEHGIFGYTDIPQGTYRLSFPNFNDLKVPPFWQIDTKRKSIIINVPSTFPVRPLNGIHISGFVSLDMERSVYPKSLIPIVKEFQYQIDVDSAKAHKSIDLFLTDLDKTLKARIELYRYLWHKKKWDTFMLVFTGTDRLSHFLWEAFDNKDHKYHSPFLEHFHQIDKAIGEIADKISEDDLLLLLSDHGFELLEAEVNINFLLKQKGFLKLRENSRRGFADIDFGTTAFSLDPARIYLNLENKYPRGSVKRNESNKIVDNLIEMFSEFEIEGREVIKKVFRKEEIYQGPYIDQAPDLVLIPNKGFHLKSGITAKKLHEKGIFTGKHTQHDAFLLVNSCFKKEIISEIPTVSDVCNIIEKFSSIR